MPLRHISQLTDWPNSGNSTGARDTGTSPPSGKRQPCAPQRKHPFQFGPQHPLHFVKSEIQPEKGHFRNTLIFLDFTKNRLAKEDDSGGKYVPKFRTAMQFGERDFSLRKRKSDFKRQETTRNILSFGMVVLLLLSFLAIASMIVVLSWHYVVSDAFHWLSDEQLGDMKSLLFSGAVAGAVAAFVQRHTS